MLEEVTVPLPGGVAQVPSPRQNVLDEALIPLFRLPTGRFPVTIEPRLTCPQLGLPEAFPIKRVVVVP